MPVLAAAISKTSDSAIIALASWQERSIAPTSEGDMSRCAAKARGTAAPAATGKSAEIQKEALKVEADVIAAAADNPNPPIAITQEQFGALMAPIYEKVDPNGYFDVPAKLAAMSDKDVCQIYLAALAEIKALGPAKAAAVYRYSLGAKP